MARDEQSLERLLAALDDVDLGDWDRYFVEDMQDRLLFHDPVDDGPFPVTGHQWEQLERMKEQYL